MIRSTRPWRRAASLFAVAAALLGAPGASRGDITFTGPNSPTGPGDGDVEVTLEIGFGNSPNTVYPFATVRVDGGSSLEFDEIYVGSDEGFFGRLEVSGPGTKVVAEDIGLTTQPSLQVGREGDGYLLVEDGAWLDVENVSGDMTVGHLVGGVGRVVVRDTDTFVSVGQNLVVGGQGLGRLDLLGGAVMRTEDSTVAAMTIGESTTGVGEVYVDGVGTRLLVADDLVVGGLGHGELHISNQAIVDADNSNAPLATVGVEGRIALSGGTLLTNTLTVNGVLGGSGLVRGAGAGFITVATGGRVEVGPGDELRIDDTVVNAGSLEVDSGEAVLLEGFTNSAGTATLEPGRVVLGSALARFTEGLTNDGVIAATEGASDLHGEVTNNATGSVLVARDAVLTFYDDFTDNGGTIDVLAGGNALFLGDATFAATTALALALDSDPSLGDGAPLGVAGLATLGGDLTIDAPADYVATIGDRFTLLEAGGGLLGGFASTTLPDLPGNLEFGLLLGANDVSIEVRLETVALLDGDYNGDGVVNAIDYTVWRDGFGDIFGQQDYDVWAANYGRTALAQGQSVPEPAALVLLLVALAGAPRPRGV